MKRLIFAFFSAFLLLVSFLAPGIILKEKEVSSFPNVTVFIDPGHGGYDPGTNYDEVLEKEINMGIASFLYEEIINSNAKAYITRTHDYDLAKVNATNHKMEDLINRVKMINDSNADILISLHLNAINDKSVFGPMVYYRKDDDKSKTLATSVQEELNLLTNLNKIIHPERYYLFRKTTLPAILVECGFLSNTIERKKLLSLDYQKEVAKAIINGVNSYLSTQF